MNIYKKVTKYIIINITILIIIYLFYINNIRICLIYNLFKIPCAGCGLTRSIIHITKFELNKSIEYNLLGIPILVIYIICFIWKVIDIIKGKKTFNIWLNKNEKKIILISCIIFIIVFFRNVFNPLLYN